MYEAFYGLSEKPFNLTPDPRFLYLSSKHKEAFAHLLYGIRNRCGFVMVSGEIGTGKTTICRSLLKQLDPDTEVAFIFNPKLSPIDLLKTINADFGIDSKAETVRGLINELNEYLLTRSAGGKNCVLIIDEAQNLGTETLEQIRLLSNLETETAKLLQIVLIGQPELAQKLELPELRQLNQRITARYHLGTLNREETLHYIAFRLRVAGGRKKVMFTRRAVRAVHKLSGGTPRVINGLCDRALLIGYTKDTRTITPRIVKKAAEEIQGDYRVRIGNARFARLLPASALATSAALVVLLVLLLTGPLPTPSDWVEFARSEFGSFASGQPAAEPPGNVPASSDVYHDGDSEDARVDPIQIGTAEENAANDAIARTLRGVVEAASVTDAIDVGSAAENDGPTGSEVDQREATAKLARVPENANDDVQTAPTSVESPQPHEGLAELVHAWNLAMLEDPPAEVTPARLQEFATTTGLRLTALQSSIAQLLAINLPMLVQIKDEAGESWAALMRVEDGKVQVTDGDGASELVSRRSLEDRYGGQAYCLWNDPAPNTEILRAMVQSDEVEQLQKDLSTLGLLDREPTGVYDAATIDAVTKIQRAMGLAADGIAGPQTRMVLCSWLDRYDTPHLAAAAYSEDARARVLGSQGMVSARAGKSADEFASVPLPESFEELTPVEETPSSPNVRTAPRQSALPIGSAADVPQPSGDEQRVEDAPVNAEDLGQPGYTPQLESSAFVAEPSVTASWGPSVPIVPRSEGENASQ